MRIVIVLLAAFVFSGCALKTPFSAAITADGKYWVVKEPLVYEQPKTKQTFVVPRGFVTDLASVPRVFWAAFPPCGKYTPATVVHDYLYWYQPQICDQKCADDLLLVAMEESKVDLVSRNAIYAGVRATGKSAWEENKKLRQQGVIRHVPGEHMNFSPYDTWENIESRIRSGSVGMPGAK